MAGLKRTPKKGDYRKFVKVEILEDTKARKKGEVVEMHPILANRLVAIEKAKTTTKKLTARLHVGTVSKKETEE